VYSTIIWLGSKERLLRTPYPRSAVLNCQNRYMFYECDNGNCRLGPECGNRNFEGLKQRGVFHNNLVGLEGTIAADAISAICCLDDFDSNVILLKTLAVMRIARTAICSTSATTVTAGWVLSAVTETSRALSSFLFAFQKLPASPTKTSRLSVSPHIIM
jgi:hypothetical protein